MFFPFLKISEKMLIFKMFRIKADLLNLKTSFQWLTPQSKQSVCLQNANGGLQSLVLESGPQNRSADAEASHSKEMGSRSRKQPKQVEKEERSKGWQRVCWISH